MTNTMTADHIRIVPAPRRLSPRQAEALRRRKRKALWNTLGEILTTAGLAACFLLCAVLLLCAV